MQFAGDASEGNDLAISGLCLTANNRAFLTHVAEIKAHDLDVIVCRDQLDVPVVHDPRPVAIPNGVARVNPIRQQVAQNF